tara:strand:+ start:966 stop:1493 length:528 start_codon:yes stop_codon:yes gene_type:complete
MNKRRKKIVKLVPLRSIRFKSIYLTSIILIFGLLTKLIYLQVFDASNLKNRALSRQMKRTNVIRSRRQIVDRNNRIVAFDKNQYELWGHPNYFRFPGDKTNKRRTIEEVVNKLSPILNLEKKSLLKKFKNTNDGVRLINDLNEEEAKNIKNLNISGIDLDLSLKDFIHRVIYSQI